MALKTTQVPDEYGLFCVMACVRWVEWEREGQSREGEGVMLLQPVLTTSVLPQPPLYLIPIPIPVYQPSILLLTARVALGEIAFVFIYPPGTGDAWQHVLPSSHPILSSSSPAPFFPLQHHLLFASRQRRKTNSESCWACATGSLCSTSPGIVQCYGFCCYCTSTGTNDGAGRQQTGGGEL